MKPTDIWTNHPDPKFKPMCHNGDACHEKAPRGSKTGTQGIAGSVYRAVIPKQLCEHIVDICEEGENNMDEKDKEIQELRRKIAVLVGENATDDILLNRLTELMRTMIFGMSAVIDKATEELKEIYENIERTNK